MRQTKGEGLVAGETGVSYSERALSDANDDDDESPRDVHDFGHYTDELQVPLNSQDFLNMPASEEVAVDEEL